MSHASIAQLYVLVVHGDGVHGPFNSHEAAESYARTDVYPDPEQYEHAQVNADFYVSELTAPSGRPSIAAVVARYVGEGAGPEVTAEGVARALGY